MTSFRLEAIEIENLRTIRKLRLELSGLMVLLGENGSGKSSILEAIELLRRIGANTFEPDFREIHGGEDLLLRRGERSFRLAVEGGLAGHEERARYEIVVSFARATYMVSRERLTVEGAHRAQPTEVLDRDDAKARVYDDEREHFRVQTLSGPTRPLLADRALTHPACAAVRDALASLEVHGGFDVAPWWMARSQRREAPLRDRSHVSREDRLGLFGANLAAAYHTLKNEHPYHAAWPRILDWARLGIGEHVEDVLLPSAGAGYVELALKLRGMDVPVRSAGLSSGQLAWLAFVALAHLGADRRAALAFDEPELHLHPTLLARATQLFAEVSERHPVILATHSRRLLDALGDAAADAAVVCELDPSTQSTRLRRFDRAALAAWLERYEGLGQVLDAGYGEQVLLPPEGPESP